MGLPERTQCFTMFIVNDMIQVRKLLTWLFLSKLEVYFFIARQADRRANIVGSLFIPVVVLG